MINTPHSPAKAGLIVFFLLIAVMIGLVIVDPTGIFEKQAGSFGLPVGFVLIGFMGLIPLFLASFNRWQWGIQALSGCRATRKPVPRSGTIRVFD